MTIFLDEEEFIDRCGNYKILWLVDDCFLVFDYVNGIAGIATSCLYTKFDFNYFKKYSSNKKPILFNSKNTKVDISVYYDKLGYFVKNDCFIVVVPFEKQSEGIKSIYIRFLAVKEDGSYTFMDNKVLSVEEQEILDVVVKTNWGNEKAINSVIDCEDALRKLPSNGLPIEISVNIGEGWSVGNIDIELVVKNDFSINKRFIIVDEKAENYIVSRGD